MPLKKRHLLKNDSDITAPVVIEDIIKKLISISRSAAILEIDDQKNAYEKVRDGLRDAETMIRELRHRVRFEIMPEVKEGLKVKGKKPTSDASNISKEDVKKGQEKALEVRRSKMQPKINLSSNKK